MRVADNVIISELEAILSAMMWAEGGLSIEEIRERLSFSIELRTLQRRLARLKEEGKLTISGDTRSTRYHLSGPQALTMLEEAPVVYGAGGEVLLSPLGRQVLQLMMQPKNLRQPVGYKREFLELYRPNKDGYLSHEEKKKLAGLSQTSSIGEPAGTYARKVLNRLLIDLSWNSSRLEGNTYSLLDTERLINLGEAADHRSSVETQMIINHKEAIEFLVQPGEEIGLNRYTLLNLHALLSHNLMDNPLSSGRLRQIGVGIHQSVFVPLGVPQTIEEMFSLIMEKAGQIENQFEKSFFLMVHLPYLQPFEDVNKRVSRLAANIPFFRDNLSPLSFVDVPKDLYVQGLLAIYEHNRVELLKDIFMWAYERSANRYAAIRHSLGQPDMFKMRYRNEIRELVASVVTNRQSSKIASARIRDAAERLPPEDRSRFVEAVETELMSLHEGNFARYWIKPSEFALWKEMWPG